MASKKASHGGPRSGAGRPTSGRDDVAVKMDRAIVARGRYVAEIRGLSLAEYLSESVRAVVDRDFERTVREGAKGTAQTE
ncbi:MAG: hypothetical protein JWN86_444 [Planctomycetota bacterium]|nr:hypothetical protein [Planctomycetota bacterium]